MFKRFYHQGGGYFVTTNTKRRLPFFLDNGCSQMFMEELEYAKKKCNFELYSFIIMPDHVHMLICPKGEKNISQVMHFIKRNSSRHINDSNKSKSSTVTKDDHPWLQGEDLMNHRRRLENMKVALPENFEWQPSFHDRLIRSDREFNDVLDYINIKNLNDLNTKYNILIENKLYSYPYYSYTNMDLIDPI